MMISSVKVVNVFQTLALNSSFIVFLSLFVIAVRSRVLLSVDDLDSDEFIEFFPSSNIFDAMDQLMPSGQAKSLAAENETKSTISLGTVAVEARNNESHLISSAA